MSPWYRRCWWFFLTFLISLLIAFLTVSSSETVYSSALSEFELGQISDKTIVADVSLPADGDYPIEVIAGEKIIRKGFPVTEIALAKLNKMAAAPTYIDYKTFSYKILPTKALQNCNLLIKALPFRIKQSLQEPMRESLSLLMQ